ncbi:MAG TPA: bifunctional UDP-sugar hydrolase/5'-nucleotidase [Pyrinomonadaceae bacterium]|jgi:5'-nucleotidase|nr:bifunctional UDP-sugar hydrolase/5'-nucleotidase [Pyrinomonadaceae bacterium]
MALIRPSTRRAALALTMLLLVLLALMAAHGGARAQTQASKCVRITLLQVNDVYQFMPVDRGTSGGLARVSTLRKQIMKDSPNTLFLFSGDTISPSVESIKLKGQQMIDAWNQIGLDYATLGNHEFDFGPEELLKRMKESRFQWLAANVVDAKGNSFGGMPPFVVRDVGGIRVGFFGILLPATMTTSRPGPDVKILDSCETARRVVPQMRAAGAKIIIALTHLSMREDKQLAHCVPDIDLIIGGHEHTLLQSLANRTPIFKMTADARQLGRYDLTVDAATGKLQSIDWEVIPVNDKVEEDPQFASVTEKYKEFLASYGEMVGRTSVRLDARSEANRTGETNVGDFIADAFRQTMAADVALINGGSIRADTIFEPGPLSKHDVLAILPFGTEVVKIEVTGATLRKTLEHGVSQSGRGEEPGRFPQVSGLRFSFDASQPAGHRIKKLTVGGHPLDDRKTYTLATNVYLIGGGDDYDMLKGARQLTKQGEAQIDSEILRKAIASVQAIAPQTDGRIEWLNKPVEDNQTECITVINAAGSK